MQGYREGGGGSSPSSMHPHQWRIQELPKGGAHTNVNCTTLCDKHFYYESYSVILGERGGGMYPKCHSLDPPMPICTPLHA